jgi:2-polyprenyl-3-methyl-5-hydroxy-6-metoxy-1,4-benzoquinol methylase
MKKCVQSGAIRLSTMEPTEGTATRLWEGSAVLPGNLAKLRLLLRLEQIVQERESPSVCDVGCVGPDPFNLWKPMFEQYPHEFELSGIDLFGIDIARRMAAERGWQADLRTGDATAIAAAFPGLQFDIVVCTGVLQALPNWESFFDEARRVLAPNGRVLLTAVSRQASIPRRTELRHLARRLASRVPGQGFRWYRGLRADEVMAAAGARGFAVRDSLRCNIAAIKPLHNSSPASSQNELLRRWLLLEEALLESGAAERHPDAFLEFFLDLELQ